MDEPQIIAPARELDIASVDAFRAELLEATEKLGDGVVVDLSDVAFIDSSGLEVIMEAGERLRRERRGFAVVAPRGTAAAVLLTLAGLRSRIAVFESRSAALRTVAPNRRRSDE